MKIDSTTLHLSLINSTKSEPMTHEHTAPKATSRHTPSSLTTMNISDALDKASDVDMSRVNELRQTLTQGRLVLDPDKLADAILSTHRL